MDPNGRERGESRAVAGEPPGAARSAAPSRARPDVPRGSRPAGAGAARLRRLHELAGPLEVPADAPACVVRLAAEYNDTARAFLEQAEALASSAHLDAVSAADAVAVARSFEALMSHRAHVQWELGVGDEGSTERHAPTDRERGGRWRRS